MYNYLENIKEDIRQRLEDNQNKIIIENEFNNYDKLNEYLHDELRANDDITWNWSWSYTFNRFRARNNLEGNDDLVEEMAKEFWVDMWKHRNDYEYLDVSIRCYLLKQAIEETTEEHTRQCDECWKIFFDWYICEDWWLYYCSNECLENSLVEDETIESLHLWEENSPNYRTTRIE